jgi:3-hydroxyisobutyrate dehydrogenase-like beta-hydroxyacid dehydrogenase
LAKAYPDLTVYDVAPGALESFEGKARVATSIANVGRDAELVGVCVRDDSASQAGIGQKDLELAASVAAELKVEVPSALHAKGLVHRAMLER